ncbi:hypothetical protein NPIL_122811 [Nephila pilipes]|uniref:Uncharacterized protein n=1 Tax=Nephila pilipes TaxID=299642 RepID=A0A8X6PJU2_NEPPI|nr:hypothetical protein NPIL_122811 [Nephila pilipes]
MAGDRRDWVYRFKAAGTSKGLQRADSLLPSEVFPVLPRKVKSNDFFAQNLQNMMRLFIKSAHKGRTHDWSESSLPLPTDCAAQRAKMIETRGQS